MQGSGELATQASDGTGAHISAPVPVPGRAPAYYLVQMDPASGNILSKTGLRAPEQ
jgi:hypothetical protein